MVEKYPKMVSAMSVEKVINEWRWTGPRNIIFWINL